MGFGSKIGPNVAVGCTATTGRCGTLLAFGWAFYSFGGDVVLSYGCVTLTLAQWRQQLTALCATHVPDDVATYERAISALLDYAEAEIAARSTVGKAADALGTREARFAKVAAEMAKATDPEQPIPDLINLYLDCRRWAKLLEGD
jgi:hypothetical protein